MYYIGAGSMDPGGGPTSSSNGVKFRIDGGKWTDIENAKSNSVCAYSCKNKKWTSEYTLGYLGGRKSYACEDGGGCVPGVKFTAKVKIDSMERSCTSTKSSEFIGIATSTASTCAVLFDFDDTPGKRDLEEEIKRAIAWEG